MLPAVTGNEFGERNGTRIGGKKIGLDWWSHWTP